MTGTLVSDKGRVELNSIDAKKIIEEFGIPKEMDVILDGKITPTQIIAMVRPVIERFISEVTRSIDYYQREFNARVEKILMTGEGSNIKGLNDFISKNLNLNVDYLKLREGLLCGASLGAALGYKGAINLLPEELKQKKEVQVKKTALRVSTVAVLGILFFSFLTISIQIKSYKEQLDLVRNQKAILKDLKDIQDRIDQRSAVISSIRESETPVDLVLKELSNITPGNIAFLEVSLNQKEKSLKLRGRVSAKPEVVQGILSDFMEMLEKSIFIKEANLSNVQKETAGAGELSIFEINCVLE